jgi:hypothetical protein
LEPVEQYAAKSCVGSCGRPSQAKCYLHRRRFAGLVQEPRRRRHLVSSERRFGNGTGGAIRITALAIDPENPDRIFAERAIWVGTSRVELIPLGLMESRDGGVTWYAIDVPALDEAIGHLAVTNGTLYAATGEQVISVELAAEDQLYSSAVERRDGQKRPDRTMRRRNAEGNGT